MPVLNRCRMVAARRPRSNPHLALAAGPAALARIARMLLLAACSLHCTATMANAQSTPLSESEIKAGFLFNFTKFVEWPPDAFADPSSPIVMGIVGDNPVIGLLAGTASGKTVNGRAVLVRRFKEGQDLRSCHILFVSASEEKHVPQILESLKGSRVLTVGETSGFTESGGMINFLVEGSRVRLDINLDPAARSRLKISAKVIAVARVVTGEASGGKS